MLTLTRDSRWKLETSSLAAEDFPAKKESLPACIHLRGKFDTVTSCWKGKCNWAIAISCAGVDGCGRPSASPCLFLRMTDH